MNYLKYWKLAKYYIKKKHDLSEDDLDCLLFIYKSKPFTASEFGIYDNMFVFTPSRLKRLVNTGLIAVFREKTRREAATYVISERGKKVCDDVYAVLDGKKRVPMLDTGTFQNAVYNITARKLLRDKRVPKE